MLSLCKNIFRLKNIFTDPSYRHPHARVRDPAAADPLHGQRDPHRGRRHLLQSLRPRQSRLQAAGLQRGNNIRNFEYHWIS